jgi:RNA polymerase sigma-70 factor (ECF subfamily)
MNDQALPRPGPAEDVMQREAAESVWRAVDRLAPDERELVLLRYVGGRTFREIADILGRPLGTVLWQGKRCLEKLKDMMTNGSEASGDR